MPVALQVGDAIAGDDRLGSRVVEAQQILVADDRDDRATAQSRAWPGLVVGDRTLGDVQALADGDQILEHLRDLRLMDGEAQQPAGRLR